MSKLEQLLEYLVKDLQGVVSDEGPALWVSQDDLTSALTALQSFDFGPLGPSQLQLGICYDYLSGMVKIDLLDVDFSCIGYDNNQVYDLLASISQREH